MARSEGNYNLVIKVYINSHASSSKQLSQATAASPLPRHQTNLADDKQDKANEKYREIVLGLPKEKGWKTRYLCLYQGFWYDTEYGIQGVMFVQQYFKAKQSDILLATSPKSGTTWLKALCYAIVNRAQCNYLTHPLLTTNPHNCVRFLELDLFCDSLPNEEIESLPSPRLFASHIPYTSLPESLTNSACKIVCLCRDPKDIFVSFWHYLTKLREKSLPPLSLQEAFDLFSKGVSPFGPRWDHMLGYWKASLESPSKVLFLKYEDMKKEPLAYLKKLAFFLQHPFTLEEETDGAPDAISELCSFKHLSKLDVNKKETSLFNVKNDLFFRKGEVGDWKKHLTAEMAGKLDQITKQKFDDFGLMF